MLSGAIRCHQQVPRPIAESALARSASAAGRASAPWRDPRRIAPPPLSPPTDASPMACRGAAAAELPWGRRRVHRVRRARAARSKSSNGRKHAAPLSGTRRHTEAIRGHQRSSSGSSSVVIIRVISVAPGIPEATPATVQGPRSTHRRPRPPVPARPRARARADGDRARWRARARARALTSRRSSLRS